MKQVFRYNQGEKRGGGGVCLYGCGINFFLGTFNPALLRKEQLRIKKVGGGPETGLKECLDTMPPPVKREE